METPSVEVTVTPEVVTPAIDTLVDCRQILTALEAHSTLSEARHNEILEEVDQCQRSLEALSTSQMESPSLAQLLLQVGELKSQVAELQASLKKFEDSRPLTQQASASSQLEETPEVVILPGNEESAAPTNQSSQPAEPSVKKKYVKV